jgi:hypothetical protein
MCVDAASDLTFLSRHLSWLSVSQYTTSLPVLLRCFLFRSLGLLSLDGIAAQCVSNHSLLADVYASVQHERCMPGLGQCA